MPKKEEKILFDVLDECPSDTIFDANQNMFLALRHVSWNNKEANLELRKWYRDKNGNEVPTKGFSFLTNEGPDNLTHMLLNLGYGNIETIKEIINNREDTSKKESNGFKASDILHNISNKGKLDE